MMKSDTDILTAACKELGWTQIHLNDAPHHSYQGLVGTRDGSHFEPLPALLTSLDAHFAPGSTVEMMQAPGLTISIGIRVDRSWYAIFGTTYAKAANPARALTIAFLRWRQPQENWE